MTRKRSFLNAWEWLIAAFYRDAKGMRLECVKNAFRWLWIAIRGEPRP